MDRETITRGEAGEILDCGYQGVYTYIRKEILHRAPKEADGKERVFLDEVIALRDKRNERKKRIASKKRKQAKELDILPYNCSVYNTFDMMAVIDPEDTSGLAHVWFISRKAFDGLMTGTLKWDRIPVNEIYQESIMGKLPRAKYHT